MASLALFVVYSFGEAIYENFFRNHHCVNKYCHHLEYINRDIYFHNTEDGKGYVYNKYTGETLIKHVAWIAKPLGRDTLVCYSDGKKRGYFSRNTGKVVIEPKYNHAWVFSDGLASVEEDGYIKFIDGTDKTIIDQKMPYFPNMEGYVFHNGYCVVNADDGRLCGLMNKSGKIVLPREYTLVAPTNNLEMWCVAKGEERGLLDKDLNVIVPLSKCSLSVSDSMINMTMPDHTIRKYNLQGKLINDFYISQVRILEYETDEIVYRDNIFNKIDDELTEILEETYHPKASARMRAYVADGGYEGLMTADGHVVVMPLYKQIGAIGYDLYLCEVSNGDHVIINGKGEIVK